MQHFSRIVFNVFSLRTLILLVAAWLMVRAPVPDAFLQIQEQLQTYVFRAGLYTSRLPVPQTHITVVHVPDIEYERWQLDLPGAESLEQLLAKGDDTALFGLVLEQPMVLVQPAAESLLQEIQQGRRTRETRYEDVKNLLARREKLVTALTSPRLVLGLADQSSHFYRRIPVQESFSAYPPLLRNWLWPWPEPSPAAVMSPLLQYFPIDSAPSQERRLASLEGDKVIPMFPLQFWAISQSHPLQSGHQPKTLHWQRDDGFVLGVEHIRTSVGAEIVPVYGAFSGIRASMRQITLGAALAGGSLSGWVLLGRDDSPTLEQSAQVIASLGDRAFLYEPAWWTFVQKALLIATAVFLVLLVPALPLRWIVGLAFVGPAGIVTGQILGQTLLGLWLPAGDILVFGLTGLLVMLLWRWQSFAWQRVHQRADEACLALAVAAETEGRLMDALAHLRQCNSTPAVLDELYRLAQTYELQGDLPHALTVFEELRVRRFRFRDVAQQIRRLRACLRYQQDHGAAAEEPSPANLPVSAG